MLIEFLRKILQPRIVPHTRTFYVIAFPENGDIFVVSHNLEHPLAILFEDNLP